jgi:ribonucleoside-diphosphate reductase alpha chain
MGEHARKDGRPQTRGVRVRRVFTAPGVDPLDQVTWVTRDVTLVNWRDGTVNFHQPGVEFPDFWSDNAVNIVAGKYFRGRLGTPEREHSLRQLVGRVTAAYTRAGRAHGYLADDDDEQAFAAELTWMLVNQVFSFNSPVWFNVGVPGARQQVSACFLLSVEDSMESILDWYRQEGLIFKGGSGAGVNLSAIRSSREPLSSGGAASGPVSFMRGADASAGAIKSGGATRRAAKMVCLDVDHPDIREFVGCKVHEERKIRALRDAGFDMDLGGADAHSAQFQNANNSVRLTDAFMRAVQDGRPFDLTARTDGATVETVDARELFAAVAAAAWECADPGVQYHDTTNAWHTNPNSGPITTSNPCGEYVSLDDSSCNLGSLNLLAFLREDRTFDTAAFAAAVELAVTAMDISICFADFPTERIAQVTRAHRQLGLGYANLGALLTSCGWPYDSRRGRSLAAALTSLMTAVAYRRSAELAAALGPYDGWAANRDPHLKVLARHHDAHELIADYTGVSAWAVADDAWVGALDLAERNGVRNAQVTLLAPTGTIGLMMDCDTTGVEPAYALVTQKRVAAGDSMRLVGRALPAGLRALGYDDAQVADVQAHVAEHGGVVGAPHLAAEHYPVFDCAVGDGIRAISPAGHVAMVAAVQPFLSGAVSKTINLPGSATVADVETVFMQAWLSGCKSVAVHVAGSKVGAPLTAVAPGAARAPSPGAPPPAPPRRRLPRSRPSRTRSFRVGGAEGYLTAGVYDDGDGALGEVFVKMSKQGSTLAGVMDAFSVAVSVALQHGVPLATYVGKFVNMRFEPAGLTDDDDVRFATSIVDYLFRRLALDHLDPGVRRDLGIPAAAERAQPTPPASRTSAADAPLCPACGVAMRTAGNCHVCESCGSTSGCS